VATKTSLFTRRQQKTSAPANGSDLTSGPRTSANENPRSVVHRGHHLFQTKDLVAMQDYVLLAYAMTRSI
jgi:hypothetical protein